MITFNTDFSLKSSTLKNQEMNKPTFRNKMYYHKIIEDNAKTNKNNIIKKIIIALSTLVSTATAALTGKLFISDTPISFSTPEAPKKSKENIKEKVDTLELSKLEDTIFKKYPNFDINTMKKIEDFITNHPQTAKEQLEFAYNVLKSNSGNGNINYIMFILSNIERKEYDKTRELAIKWLNKRFANNPNENLEDLHKLTVNLDSHPIMAEMQLNVVDKIMKKNSTVDFDDVVNVMFSLTAPYQNEPNASLQIVYERLMKILAKYPNIDLKKLAPILKNIKNDPKTANIQLDWIEDNLKNNPNVDLGNDIIDFVRFFKYHDK